MKRITILLFSFALNLAMGTVVRSDPSLQITLEGIDTNLVAIAYGEGSPTNTSVYGLPLSHAASGYFRVYSPDQNRANYAVQFREKLDSGPWTNLPQRVEYRLHSPEDIYLPSVQWIDSQVVIQSDELPKSLVIDGETIIIKDIDVEPRPGTAFDAYLTVVYNSAEEKIGFWCVGDNYSGVLTVETSRWVTGPEVEGSTGTLCIKFIALMSIYYDIGSNNWNFMKVGSYLYKEHQYPIEIF